jgi:predicted phage terminase large subunit-like protein
MKQDGVVITRATIYENPHLDKNQVKFLEQLYGGSEMGRQELLGELIEKVKGALWDYQNIEDNRVLETEVPELSRTVVAIDPAVTSKTTSDETAISVVGKEPKNEYVPEEQFYLLENEGMREPPHVWARRAIDLYHKYEADAIVAEVNNGGDMVEHTIKTIWPNAPVKQVRATKGKVTRAEPSSLLYQKNCVHHVGVFGPLEDQMVNFGYESKPEHDDRVDSLVWAITELSTDEPFFYFG